ncbi:hypothetical protein OXE08_004525 [Salmonella enterica]|nr:hypothetical protein [Salmonella enterica]
MFHDDIANNPAPHFDAPIITVEQAQVAISHAMRSYLPQLEQLTGQAPGAVLVETAIRGVMVDEVAPGICSAFIEGRHGAVVLHFSEGEFNQMDIKAAAVALLFGAVGAEFIEFRTMHPETDSNS